MRRQCRPVALPMFEPKRPNPIQQVSEQPQLDKMISKAPPQVPVGHNRDVRSCRSREMRDSAQELSHTKFQLQDMRPATMRLCPFAMATLPRAAWYGSTHKNLKA